MGTSIFIIDSSGRSSKIDEILAYDREPPRINSSVNRKREEEKIEEKKQHNEFLSMTNKSMHTTHHAFTYNIETIESVVNELEEKLHDAEDKLDAMIKNGGVSISRTVK